MRATNFTTTLQICLLVPFLAILLSSCAKEEAIGSCPCFDDGLQVAHFKGCEGESSVEEYRKCSQFQVLRAAYSTIKYPAAAREDSIQGTVVVRFDVGVDGVVSNIRAINEPPLGFGLEEEVIRTVRVISPDAWCPAMNGCQPAPSSFTLPIKFKLQ